MTAKESFESLIFNFAPEDKEEFIMHLRRFAGQLCWEFNGFLIDKFNEDPTLISMIEDMINEFLKDKL